MIRHWWRTARKRLNEARCRRLPPGGKLHVGCGPVRLPGWINIDNRRYDAADYIIDVRDGLPFHDLAFVFAEHFIEHLPYWLAVQFLRDARKALAPAGILRLSTPNLDWVHRTQYQTGSVQDCFDLNKAFRGWGHQFLWNLTTLTAVLHDAGFDRVDVREYGHSPHPELRGLERHEKSEDAPGLPHVIIVEASGVRAAAATVDAGDFLNALGAE